MIVANQKPLKEIMAMLKGAKRILVLGCRGCTASCAAGGAKEVKILASAIRLDKKLHGEEVEVEESTLVRQCEPKYLEPLKEIGPSFDCVLSMGCGVGVNFIADRCPGVRVKPALDTTFYGAKLSQGEWREMCAGCGACVLHLTGGLCPVARCAKSLSNGPCGGSQGGRCEVDPETPCIWHQIYSKLKDFNETEQLEAIIPIRDWRPSGHGGPRHRIREDLLP